MITQLKSVVLGKKPEEQFSAEHQFGRCCSGTVFFRHVCQESYRVLHLPTDSRVQSEDDSIVTRIEEHSWLLAVPTHIISCAPFCFFCVATLSLIWVFLTFSSPLSFPQGKNSPPDIISDRRHWYLPGAHRVPEASHLLMLWLSEGLLRAVENLWASEVDLCSAVLVSA